MTRVVVRPAGAGRETLFVAGLCALIIACAATVATIRGRPSDEVVLASWRIDARDGLNAAEQGLNADLTAAAEDIRAELASGEAPSPDRLAEEALPPFAKDATAARRGAHVWSLVRDGETLGYLGVSGDNATARTLLLRIAAASGDAHGHGPENGPTVWAHASAIAVERLSDEALIAAGWTQVASRYDASVTR